LGQLLLFGVLLDQTTSSKGIESQPSCVHIHFVPI